MLSPKVIQSRITGTQLHPTNGELFQYTGNWYGNILLGLHDGSFGLLKTGYSSVSFPLSDTVRS